MWQLGRAQELALPLLNNVNRSDWQRQDWKQSTPLVHTNAHICLACIMVSQCCLQIAVRALVTCCPCFAACSASRSSSIAAAIPTAPDASSAPPPAVIHHVYRCVYFKLMHPARAQQLVAELLGTSQDRQCMHPWLGLLPSTAVICCQTHLMSYRQLCMLWCHDCTDPTMTFNTSQSGARLSACTPLHLEGQAVCTLPCVVQALCVVMHRLIIPVCTDS